MKYKSCRICLAGKDAYRMANGCTQSTFELHLSCPFCHPKNKTEFIEQAEIREKRLERNKGFRTMRELNKRWIFRIHKE